MTALISSLSSPWTPKKNCAGNLQPAASSWPPKECQCSTSSLCRPDRGIAEADGMAWRVSAQARNTALRTPTYERLQKELHDPDRGILPDSNEEPGDDSSQSIKAGSHEAVQRLIQHRKALAKQKRAETSSDDSAASTISQIVPGRPRRSLQQSEETKRRIAARMRKIHEQAAHRRRISETLTGRKYICSICGEEGHNKRSCPHAEGNAEAADEAAAFDLENGSNTQKGKTKKMKGIPYSELVAMREQRRKERREEHKDRPKTGYKGLTWHVAKSGKGSWHVQVWTGKTNKSVGYYDDEMEAAREYDKALLELRGPHAQTNLPQERPTPEPGIIQLPGSTEDEIALAVQSIMTAYQSGMRRQRIEYLLPQSADGEAGGVRQEFKAARNLVEATLLRLKELPQFKGRVSVQWLDKSDCVGAWQSETLAAVVFCTADCLPQLRNLDGGDFSDRLMLVFNPQWQIGGQIFSDFGFGQRRREAEDFVSSFREVFFMQQRRVMGDNIRLLKCFDSKWQVHYIWPNGRGQLLVSAEEEPPTYQRLLTLLQAVPGSKSSRTWVERVLTPDWLPGSAVPLDPEGLQSGPNSGSEPAQDLTVVRGDGDSAAVQAHEPSKSFQDLKVSVADIASSPVTNPSQQNPIESPKTLAAAAATNTEALRPLQKDTAMSRREDLPPDPGQERDLAGGTMQLKQQHDRGSSRMPTRLERFGNGEPTRSFQMDPLNHMPQWQKQLLSNSFGHDRGDEERLANERKIARLTERKKRLAAELSKRLKSAEEHRDKTT